MSLTKRRHGPIRPETWAISMLCILGACGIATLVIFFLGGLSLAGLGGMFLLLILGALSVLLRYLSNAPPAEN